MLSVRQPRRIRVVLGYRLPSIAVASPDRHALVRRGRWLSAATLFYNSLEGALGIALGLAAGSVALVGHVATFDARESEQYNRANCEVAKQLFSSQPGVQHENASRQPVRSAHQGSDSQHELGLTHHLTAQRYLSTTMSAVR